MSDSENLKKALEPKSDQLNADDLIAGPIDVVIRKVTIAASGEQRISLYYHGDNNKPYKPGKAMGRVIMDLWGDEPAKWIARGLRLYRDPEVKFGKDQVGGIRISHMTDIKETTSVPMTVKRGERKAHIVKPLVMQKPAGQTQQQGGNEPPPYDVEAAKAAGKVEAAKGIDALKAWWTAQNGHHAKLGGEAFLNELKAIAANPPQQNSEPAQQASAGKEEEAPFDV